MFYSGNYRLSDEQMTINANHIYNYLSNEGWTKNAICGMLGNLQTESRMNPGAWQDYTVGHDGYGLVQWTPYSKYFEWCDANGLSYPHMDSALKRILWEVENNAQWGANKDVGQPPYDFATFTQSEETPYQLGLNFLWFYERPAETYQYQRGTQAEYWYENLTGNAGGNGGYIPKKTGFKSFLYLRRKVIRT